MVIQAATPVTAPCQHARQLTGMGHVIPSSEPMDDPSVQQRNVNTSRRIRSAAVLTSLWLVVFAGYRLTERVISIDDVQAMVRLPISMWNERNLDLDEFSESMSRFPKVTLEHNGHTVSKFPFWPAFQLFPAYAAYALWNGFPTEDTLWDAQRWAANHAYTGHPLGFYGMMAGAQTFPSPTLGLALVGNLVSPSRGLLVFSPWVLLAFVGLVGRLNHDRAVAWTLGLGCSTHLVLTSSFNPWHGGGSMGPRLTADLLPAWSYLVAEGIAWCRNRRWAAGIAGLGIAVSVLVAGGHAFSHSEQWENTPVTAHEAPDRLFDWRDALVLDPFRTKPYEDRYPIRLVSPESGAQNSDPAIVFRWHDERSRKATYRVDISLRHLPRGVRVTTESFFATEPDQLVIRVGSLPVTFDPRQPEAWRVHAVDDEGAVMASSGWRRLRWSPHVTPPVAARATLSFCLSRGAMLSG
jgi:hypothetical protein